MLNFQCFCESARTRTMSLFCPDLFVSDAPLLQTNGKLPLWFKKLVSLRPLTLSSSICSQIMINHTIDCVCVCVFVQQGQGGASSTIQSESEPRQVRSRWAEQMNPLTFCSNFSPSLNKSQGEEDEEEEEEEGFHPQSLEYLLEDEEKEVRTRLPDQ